MWNDFEKEKDWIIRKKGKKEHEKERKKKTSIGKDVEKLESLCIAGGHAKLCSHCGKQHGSPQKIQHRIIIWSSSSTSGYLCKKIESRDSNRYLYTYIHISITHKRQKVERVQMCISRWIDKQNVNIYIQWNIIQPQKEMKFWHMLQHRWMNEPWRHYAKWIS